MQAVERLLSRQRRTWLLLTLATITVMYTWHATNELAILIEAEPEGDMDAGSSLLSRAEHNIARHLKIPHRVTSEQGNIWALSDGVPALRARLKFRGMVGNDLPGGVAVQQTQSQTQKPAATQQAAAKTRAAPAATAATAAAGGSEAAAAGGSGAAAAGSGAAEVGSCEGSNVLQHTDYWGEALVGGMSHKKDTAAECCAACKNYKPTKDNEDMTCNVWVHCSDAALCGEHHRECWLKHLAHPYGTAPAREGPDVGWSTGIMVPKAEVAAVAGGEERRFHVVITAAGNAVHWQSRVGYYWYKKVKKQCEAQGNCQMGSFTRVLHTGKPDDLMNEIPSWVAQPLPAEHPDHGYIVLNRPYALMQWVSQVTIPEKYVLMSEPDHVWLKPMPNLMRGEHPAAFPFFYIEPSKKEFNPIVAKFVGPVTLKQSEEIAPIGNAPTMMSWEDMKKVMPLFFNMSIAVHNDPEASNAWGWVQEMYAFTLSCYKAGIRGIDLHLKMMAQPPYDEKLAPFYLLHYTYGMDYTLEGVFTPGKYGEWRFDKRTYGINPPPRKLGEPPQGMKNELVRHLIHAINEATEKIPGWDDYAKTGVAKELWDGVV